MRRIVIYAVDVVHKHKTIQANVQGTRVCRNDNGLILALYLYNYLFNCIGDRADALNFAGNHITRLEEVWRHKTHTYSGRCAGSDDGAGF